MTENLKAPLLLATPSNLPLTERRAYIDKEPLCVVSAHAYCTRHPSGSQGGSQHSNPAWSEDASVFEKFLMQALHQDF